QESNLTYNHSGFHASTNGAMSCHCTPSLAKTSHSSARRTTAHLSRARLSTSPFGPRPCAESNRTQDHQGHFSCRLLLGEVGVHCAALDDVRAARAGKFLCFQVSAGDRCEDRPLWDPSLGCDLCRREGVCVIGHDMKVADDAQ